MYSFLLNIGNLILWLRTKCRALDKTISNLEMELAAARVTQESILINSQISEDVKISESRGKRKYLMVIGINTAFSSRKRRDSVRETWMPQGMCIVYPQFVSFLFCIMFLWNLINPYFNMKSGDKRKKLEEEKGIVIRFVIGHRWVLNMIVNMLLAIHFFFCPFFLYKLL